MKLIMRRRFICFACMPLLLGCSSADSEPEHQPQNKPDAQIDCSTSASNQRIYQLLKDVYLWHDHLPQIDPNTFESPKSLIESIRYNEFDRWSYIDTIAQNNTYYNEGKRIGIGLRMRGDTDGSLRISLVYPDSPASDHSLTRGDRILSINGKTIAEIEQNDAWSTILGPDEEGISVELAIQPPNDSPQNITLVKRLYSLITTHTYKIFPFAGRTVGYLLFDRFIGTSTAELDKVFAEFKAQNVNELILDLRYNGGGYIDVSHHLANLIGGQYTAGKVFTQIVHNEHHPNWNKNQIFQNVGQSLGLPRAFIIASPATASASEQLINGLASNIDIILIGQTTYGKPVGSGVWTDCDLSIHPISFRMLNSEGHGDFFNGIHPTCSARDNLDLQLGDQNESSLAEALYVMKTGSCTINAAPPFGVAIPNAEPRIHMPDEIGVFSF